jgi:hypothetical protein
MSLCSILGHTVFDKFNSFHLRLQNIYNIYSQYNIKIHKIFKKESHT